MAAEDFTLTIRIHDPLEKKDSTKSAVWVTASVKRADVAEMTRQEFLERYLEPAIDQLHILKFKDSPNG